MGESLILRFYQFFNGQPVAIEQLLDYRKKVEQYIDAIGSGEYVPKLSAIKTSVTQTIKNLQAQGVTDIEKMELVNDPKPTLAGPRGYVPPPPAAFAAMQKSGTLWPSKRTNPFAKNELTKNVKTKVVEVKPDNIVAEELPIAEIHTDTKRFQNRQGAFSEASAQSVAENFDPNKFDPIVVWRDPKAKKLFVLSGHSRYEGMKRRKSKTIAVRYFTGTEEKAIQFAKVEANRAANQENLIEDLAAYKLMRDGDKARGISKATKGELQRIFKGKSSKLESYSYLSDKGLFVQALNQSTTSNYPYLERNAQWVGILRNQYPVISNQGEDNIFHFFYSDKSGKNIKLSKDEFFALAKKKINLLRKGESVLFPECSSEGCKQTVDRENDTQKGESFKRLREINEQLESITEKLTSKDATVRVTTDEEKKYLRTVAEKLQQEKERINRDLDLIDKSQASLFGVKTDRSGNFIGDGKFHAEFDVFEFSDFPQVKSKVEKSSTTESVYVHYFNTENEKRVTVRYSNHENNATKFGDQLNGHTTNRQEVLYKLGILSRKFIPNLIPSIPTQQVKKTKLKDFVQSDKTIQELYEMVRNKKSIAKYVGKLTKGQNYLVTGEGVIIEDKDKDVFGNVIVKGKFEYFDPKLNGPQIDAFPDVQKVKPTRGKLNRLQLKQLQESIAAGATTKVYPKAKGGEKKGWSDTPLFSEGAAPSKDPKQTSLFGKKPATKNQTVSASHLAGIAYKIFDLTDQYKTDFNKLNSDTQVMIWGTPGSGKTVYLLKFAQYLAEKQNLKVLYVANEEFGRSTFAQKLKEFNIGHNNLSFAKQPTSDLINRYDVIFADSVNSIGMKLADYRALVQNHPGKMFVIIVQSTKDGDFRGGKDWEHEVDIAGEIKNRQLILRKNRLDGNNANKAAQLQKQDAIAEAKKKLEVKQAVKNAMNKTT